MLSLHKVVWIQIIVGTLAIIIIGIPLTTISFLTKIWLCLR